MEKTKKSKGSSKEKETDSEKSKESKVETTIPVAVPIRGQAYQGKEVRCICRVGKRRGKREQSEWKSK